MVEAIILILQTGVCLFCLERNVPFTKVEHIIPESLGNDDLYLPPGYICDLCNNYFGIKVENHVLNSPPFSVERTAAAITTKKGKYPNFEIAPGLSGYSTGKLNTISIKQSQEKNYHLELLDLFFNKKAIVLPHKNNGYLQIIRMLIKMGLELLLYSDINPYSVQFNKSRRFSRFADPGVGWQLAYGQYPNRDDLVVSVREDEISPLITYQVYEYSLGKLINGDICLCFMYRTHMFACNLCKPSIDEYVTDFNSNNTFRLNIFNTKA